ncbi:MAG: recombinase family protein, partial [Culicoidibacterales bacterium]
MAIYGYVRCSTNETKQDVTRQKNDIKKMLNGERISKIFEEYASGTKHNREQLQAMLAITQKGDTIIATEVSRLSRSTQQFLTLVDLVQSKQLRLIAGNINIDCRQGEKGDPITLATLRLMAVFAELERDMMSERVKSGIETARKKGIKLGRPETTIKDIPASVIRCFENKQNNTHT